MEKSEAILPLPQDTDYWIMAQKKFKPWECPDLKGVNERLEELFDQIADVEITDVEAGDILGQIGMNDYWRYSAARDFRSSTPLKALIEIWTYRKTITPSEVIEIRNQEEESLRQKAGISPQRAKQRLEFLGFEEGEYDEPYLYGFGSHETRALIAIAGYPEGRYLLGNEYMKQRILDGESPHRVPPPDSLR